MSESTETPSQSGEVCNFFRKPTKGKNIRKRSVVDEEEDDLNNEAAVVINKKRPSTVDNKLHFERVENDSRATATLQTETEFTRDARAIRERQLKQAEEEMKGKSKTGGDEKLYKGIHGYTDYKAGFRRELTVASEKAGGSHGPLRASAHIRTTQRFDYQPDICKDYKETGYCGYGDSCKFMHDRGDYKSGWQIEKEWEEAEKLRKRKLALGMLEDDEEAAGEVDEDDDDALPFALYGGYSLAACCYANTSIKTPCKNKKCFVCTYSLESSLQHGFLKLQERPPDGNKPPVFA
ncbi:hypothetical protein Leryth_025025 [Lithospermum erythrorhizon]|nr:hypothetical protein Leryth_025025 [Lithospermum erythrorhizon]